MKGCLSLIVVALVLLTMSCTIPIALPEDAIPEFEFVIGGEDHFEIRPLTAQELEEIGFVYVLENPLVGEDESEWLLERIERVKLDLIVWFSDDPDPTPLFPLNLQLFVSPEDYSSSHADILVDLEVNSDVHYTIDSSVSGGANHLIEFFKSGEESREFFFTLRHNFGAEFDGETVHATGTLRIEGTLYIRVP